MNRGTLAGLSFFEPRLHLVWSIRYVDSQIDAQSGAVAIIGCIEPRVARLALQIYVKRGWALGQSSMHTGESLLSGATRMPKCCVLYVLDISSGFDPDWMLAHPDATLPPCLHVT